MIRKENSNSEAIILAIGGGGLNIATDLAKSKLISSYNIIAFDDEKERLEKNFTKESEIKFCGIEDFPDLVKHLLAKNFQTESNPSKFGPLYDTMIICSTLGGRFSNAVAPLTGMLGRLGDIYRISLLTMPAKFEGIEIYEKALQAKDRIIKACDVSIIMNNELLKEEKDLYLNDINEPLIETFKFFWNKESNAHGFMYDENSALVRIIRNPLLEETDDN